LQHKKYKPQKERPACCSSILSAVIVVASREDLSSLLGNRVLMEGEQENVVVTTLKLSLSLLKRVLSKRGEKTLKKQQI